MNHKISILIPCYNAEKWIKQCIESALNQTYANKEIIVVDDGSTDGSLEIIKSFGDSIHWQTGKNQGGNIARNRLLELSTGEWLQYLDADDYLLPDKIESQIKYLENFPDVDVFYSPSILEYWDSEYIKQEILPIPEPHDPWILLARWYLPQTGSSLWYKQAILDVGGWKPDQPCCQEHELYLRLLLKGKKLVYSPLIGSVYRQWSETTVCKKDWRLTYFHRLAITNSLETFLLSNGQLTPLRQDAINQARFECSRTLWPRDPSWAKKLFRQIKTTQPSFQPLGTAAPLLYRVFSATLGFENAERIASLNRWIGSFSLSKKKA